MFRGSTTHERKGDLQGKKRSANVYMYSIVTHNNTIQTAIVSPASIDKHKHLFNQFPRAIWC